MIRLALPLGDVAATIQPVHPFDRALVEWEESQRVKQWHDEARRWTERALCEYPRCYATATVYMLPWAYPVPGSFWCNQHHPLIGYGAVRAAGFHPDGSFWPIWGEEHAGR